MRQQLFWVWGFELFLGVEVPGGRDGHRSLQTVREDLQITAVSLRFLQRLSTTQRRTHV